MPPNRGIGATDEQAALPMPPDDALLQPSEHVVLVGRAMIFDGQDR